MSKTTPFFCTRVSGLILVVVFFVCYYSANPAKGESHNGETKRGVVPSELPMSPLQVDMPEYHSGHLVPRRITRDVKQKRHVHRLLHHKHIHSAKPDVIGYCCPTVEEIVEPIGGKSKSGHFVELFQADDIRQQFHEISCAPNVAKQTCRFANETLIGRSGCVQQYSYSYALVRNFKLKNAMPVPTSGWKFEHIRIRSGCSCIISNP